MAYTGIALPAEDPGRVIPAARWGTSDVVSVVQGYAVMVTPLQLATAYCTLANGGYRVQPTLLLRDKSDNSMVEDGEPVR